MDEQANKPPDKPRCRYIICIAGPELISTGKCFLEGLPCSINCPRLTTNAQHVLRQAEDEIAMLKRKLEPVETVYMKYVGRIWQVNTPAEIYKKLMLEFWEAIAEANE